MKIGQSRMAGFVAGGLILVVLASGSVLASEEDALERLSLATSAFAWDLFQSVSNTQGNVFFSPLSLSMALAMLSAGADDETLSQLRAVLHLEGDGEWVHTGFAQLLELLDELAELSYDEGQGFSVVLANSLWLQNMFPVETPFLWTLTQQYQAKVGTVNFRSHPEEARQTINEWVSSKTKGRITELVKQGQLNTDTVLALVNAICFDAPWWRPFDEAATEAKPFTLLDGSRHDVMTMHRSLYTDYAQGDGWQLIELLYQEPRVVLDIILPDAGRFEDICERFNSEFFEQLLVAREHYDVDLALPKFSYSWGADLSNPLKLLGLTDVFETTADFSRLTSATPFFTTAVIHQATVSVSEIGTEAAAATAVMAAGGATLIPPPYVNLRMDRPFLFVIRETRTGVILFIGTVLDPRSIEI